MLVLSITPAVCLTEVNKEQIARVNSNLFKGTNDEESSLMHLKASFYLYSYSLLD